MAGTFTITPPIATGLCIFHTTLYVGILYLSPSTRPRRPLNPSDAHRHEDPNYIRSRIYAVTVATICSVLITLATVKYATGASWIAAGTEMGLWPANGLMSWVVECARVMFLVGWLFIGSLWEKFVVMEGWRAEELKQEWKWMKTWPGWRNLVAGPVTEEFVFRTGMVPLQVLAGREFSWIVWATPLFFGIAHLHHLYEYLLRNPSRVVLGIVRTLFQFLYTTMFGWFATFVFLRTGSLWTVILVHAFCNYIGVPTFGRIHNQGDGGPKWGQWVDWVHWAGHVVGLWGFCKGLWWLTEGETPLLEFGKGN